MKFKKILKGFFCKKCPKRESDGDFCRTIPTAPPLQIPASNPINHFKGVRACNHYYYERAQKN